MLCIISFIYIFTVVSQLETDKITVGQFIFYALYGLLMFFHTSQPYWTENRNKRRK